MREYTRRLAGRLIAAATLATLLPMAGCHRKPAEPAPATPTTSAEARETAPTQEGQREWQGTPLDGGDTASLRAYLRNAPEIAAKKSVIEPDARTIAFDRESTIRAIRMVTNDGSVVVLDAAEPRVQEIAEGRIIWLWNLLVRHVDTVARVGDKVVLLTSPAPLTNAFRNVDLQFEAPINLAAGFPAVAKHATVAAPPTAMKARQSSGYLMPVKWVADPPEKNPGGENSDSSSEPAAPGQEPPDGQSDSEPEWNGKQFSGSSRRFAYTVEYARRAGGMRLALEARYGDQGEGGDPSKRVPTGKIGKEMQKKVSAERNYAQEDLQDLLKKRTELEHERLVDYPKWDDLRKLAYNQKYPQMQKELDDAIEKALASLEKKRKSAASRAASKLWEIASENIDVRLRAIGEIDDFQALGDVKIVNNDLVSQSLSAHGLKTKEVLSFVGRLGKTGTETIKVPVMELPVTWSVPIPVAGLPLIFQLGVDFSLTVSLAGQHATLHVEGEYASSGQTGYKYSVDEGSSYDEGISSDGPNVSESQAMSPGVSAVVLGVQFPRVGLGLGVLGASAVSYIDAVHVITMLNSASAAIGLAGVPCKRVTYNAVTHIGVQTEVLPFLFGDSFVGKVINEKLSPKRVITKYEHKWVEPPIKACEIS